MGLLYKQLSFLIVYYILKELIFQIKLKLKNTNTRSTNNPKCQLWIIVGKHEVCLSLFQVVFSVVCLVKSILSWYNINCIDKCTNCLLQNIFSVLCRSRSWYSLALKCLNENVQAKWWWSGPYLNGMRGEPEKKISSCRDLCSLPSSFTGM